MLSLALLNSARAPRSVNFHETLPGANVFSVQGARPYMEDRWCMGRRRFASGSGEFWFAGIFDGHGGGEAASTASTKFGDMLQRMLEKELKKVKTDSEKIASIDVCMFNAIYNTFWEIQDEFERRTAEMDHDFRAEGTTATVAVSVVTNVDGSKRPNPNVLCAWAGDSRAIVVEGGDVWKVPTAPDHKPHVPAEKKRIEELGGVVFRDGGGTARVECSHSSLAVSRSLGDLGSYKRQPGDAPTENIVKRKKHYLVSPTPAVSVVSGASIAKGAPKVLVIASDGMWDVLSNEEVAKIVGEVPAMTAAEELVKACGPRPHDNVTVMIVPLPIAI